MGLNRLATLCSLTTVLATSCTTTPSEEMTDNMYTQLECAASTVDSSVKIYHFKPGYYANPANLKESYTLTGTFDDEGMSWNFSMTATQENEKLKTKFSDDLSAVIITPTYFFGNNIEITGDKVWSSTVHDYLPEVSINKQEWRERYKQFLPSIYGKVKKICEENPFAHQIQNPQDYDAAIARTTKPTLVYFHADWCGPCGMFESQRLRGFMRENTTVDLVIANIGGEYAFTTKPGWKELLEENYGIKKYSLPLVVFLGEDHSYKGNHVGNDSSFESNVRKALMK